MEIPEMDAPTHTDRSATTTSPPRSRLGQAIVAAGAAAAMMAAGLGIANAQTDETSPTDPPAAQAEPEPGVERAPAPAPAPQDEAGRHGPGADEDCDRADKPALGVAASTIGVTPEELRAALRDGQSLADVARAKSVDPKKVIDALVAERRTAIAAKVTAGDLTQAQADARLATLESRIAAHVERAGVRGPRHGGPGHRGPRGGGAGAKLDAAAAAIGIPEAELATALRGGQTIADVARSKSVDPQKVIDALVAAARAHIEEEVTEGDLTRAQADQRLAGLERRVTDLVNRAPGIGRHHQERGESTS